MLIVRYAVGGCVYNGVRSEDGRLQRLRGLPFEHLEPSGEVDDPADVRILSPVENPRIFALGYNYLLHTQEANRPAPPQPVLFMKPSTCATGPEDPIHYPLDGEIVHFEGELVAVIGRRARFVSEADALDHVFGYTCGNDVSDRAMQRRESEFNCLLVAKGYDTFAPLGPAIATGLNPANLRLQTRLNGRTLQDANTGTMLFSVPYIVSYLSRFITLLPGDLIMTGTPAGVAPIAIGDVVEIEIEGIGTLRNPVVAEPAA